jgi:glycyl-tRNA synthetase alpha subunit
MIGQAKVTSVIKTGTYGVHRISESDERRLTNFATAENTMIMHTYFQQKDINTEAWILPDQSVKNYMYHLSIHARHKSNTLDIKSCIGADNDSRHYLKNQFQADNFPEKDQSCSKSVRYNLNLL